MKKLVISAFALAVASSAQASETSDWSAYDSAYAKDAEALASTLTSQDVTGPNIGGYLQTLYNNDSDNNISGFSVPRARLMINGSRGGYGYMVEYETAGNVLLDAYVDIPVNQVKVRAGMFRPSVSRNSQTVAQNLFFIGRSQIGMNWAGRDTGAQVSGEFDALDWALSITNGADGQVDDYLIALRLAFDFMGEGIGNVEGAYGGPDEIAGTAAVAYADDAALTDGEFLLVEAHLVSNVYSFGVEIATTGDASVSGTRTSALGADSSPFTIYGTYMLTPDQWELGLRFQTLDDAADTNLIEIGVSHYLDGHNLKWTLGFTTVDSDNTAVERDMFQVQLQVVF